MTDTATDLDGVTQLPAEVSAAIDPETFDVGAWLDDVQYAEGSVTVYRSAKILNEIKELTDFLSARKEAADDARKSLVAEPMSIADEYLMDDVLDVEEAKKGIAALRAELEASGVTFHLRGISPGERKILAKTIARSLKAKPPVYEKQEDNSQVEVEPAVPGGEDHPDFGKKMEYELVARSILHAVSNSGAIDSHKHTPGEVELYESRLVSMEYIRLSNKVYELNYLSYAIDSLVTEDF